MSLKYVEQKLIEISHIILNFAGVSFEFPLSVNVVDTCQLLQETHQKK